MRKMRAANILPDFTVIKPYNVGPKNIAYYKEGGFVNLGEESVFDPVVKIEVEEAKVNDTYDVHVHLRFCNYNRYWHKSGSDSYIVAESRQPEEDTSKSSCTLWQPVGLGSSLFYLRHVQSGGIVRIDASAMALYVDDTSTTVAEKDYLTFVYWDRLVKLPKHVAFKGDNGMYLQAREFNFSVGSFRHLQFSSEDANDIRSGHQVEHMADGTVEITSDFYRTILDTYRWFYTNDWVYGDTIEPNATKNFFMVEKANGHTVTLQNAENNYYCERRSAGERVDCLGAVSLNITGESLLEVEELVSQRDIHDVTYRPEDGRVVDAKPYVAGSAMVVNDTYDDAALPYEIVYQDTKSYTFSRGIPRIAAGVSTTIHAAFPVVAAEGDAEGEIQVPAEIMDAALEWDTIKQTVTPTRVDGKVTVVARSWALVEYVGMRAKCEVPYSYAQEDTSSTGAEPDRSVHVDGMYTAINAYNLKIHVTPIK